MICNVYFIIGKINAFGYELYGVIQEVNSQAFSLAFAFTCLTNGIAIPDAKDCML
jgi:hypothetical protein